MHKIDAGYKLLKDNGQAQIGDGIMSFVSSKYKEKHKGKNYNFAAFSGGSSSSNKNDSTGSNGSKKLKFSPRKLHLDENDDSIPIKNTETKYSFDNEEGAIVIDLKHNKN